MNKPELVRNIVNKFEVEESEAAYFVGNIFSAMSEALSKGKNINIPEFGKFKIVYRIINGVRKRTVTFSPVRKFADSVNEDYNNLESHITKVFKLKNSDVLTVRELMPDENDEDYLCFIFDDKPVAEISPDISTDSKEIAGSKTRNHSVSGNITKDIHENYTGENKNVEVDYLPDVVSDKSVDNERAFELPETRRKIVHDLRDEFSIEDAGDFIVNKEKILNETILSITSLHDENVNNFFPITETSNDEIILPSNTDDIIIPFDKEKDDTFVKEKESIHEPHETDGHISDYEQSVETDGLTERINKLELPESNNVDLLVFQKLLVDDSVTEQQEPELTDTKQLIKESIPEPEKSEIEPTVIFSQEEPKSLNEALESLQHDNRSVHINTGKSKEPVSFNEVFVNKESPYGVKPPPKKHKAKKISGFLKVLFYLIFIIVFGITCFYIFKIIFDKSESNGKIENINKPGADTLKKQFASDENTKGESVQVERINGAIYRKLGLYYYIEHNIFQSINEASDKEAKLKSNMISCRVEAVMTVENTIEYRVLIGPFETLDKAKEYHKEYKSILDSVL